MAVNHLIGYAIKGYGTGMKIYSGPEQQGDALATLSSE
jgi:hypothetical protein